MMEYKYNGELYKEFTKDEAYEWGKTPAIG